MAVWLCETSLIYIKKELSRTIVRELIPRATAHGPFCCQLLRLAQAPKSAYIPCSQTYNLFCTQQPGPSFPTCLSLHGSYLLGSSCVCIIATHLISYNNLSLVSMGFSQVGTHRVRVGVAGCAQGAASWYRRLHCKFLYLCFRSR